MKNPCWDGYKMMGTKEKNGSEVPNCVKMGESSLDVPEGWVVNCAETPDDVDMSEDEYEYWNLAEGDGKKYTHTYKDSKTGRERKVRYGAKGYSIAPGTKRGDSYCARSLGDMKSHNKDCSGKDKNTPLCLSRKKWKCSGAKSSK